MTVVTYWDGLPARRRSPIQVLTRQSTAGSWTHDLLITSPTPWEPVQSRTNKLRLARQLQMLTRLQENATRRAVSLRQLSSLSIQCMYVLVGSVARGRSGQDMLTTVLAGVAGQQSIVSQVALQNTVTSHIIITHDESLLLIITHQYYSVSATGAWCCEYLHHTRCPIVTEM